LGTIDELRSKGTLSVQEAASIWGVHPETVRRYINDPRESAFVRAGGGARQGRRGRAIRLSAKAFFEALDARKQ
jgi:DeoR/GlpR family transcriptional regulator of sugar metabolism